MKQTWRWFGPTDQVTIDDMLQAGVAGVVTGLYNLAPGIIWSRESIAARKAEIAVMNDGTPSGLKWDVVESLPVSETIKTNSGDFAAHIAAYKASLRNLAAEGIRVVCYNFMPLLDWTRTDIAKRMPHGGTAMSFDLADFAMFDMHVLQRIDAAADYTQAISSAATTRFEQTNKAAIDALTTTIVAGLPGAAEHLTLDELHMALATYDDIGPDALRQNLTAFLQAVIPTAEDCGIQMCCHPDDPPWPVLGLPRVVSTQADIAFLLGAVDSHASGLTFCSGSLGARADNDLCAIINQFADRIHFAHLRNVRRADDTVPTSFFEDEHLAGSTDMIAVLRTLLQAHPNPDALPMRPDHGQDILTDLGQNSAPGYPLCGRMKGLAELRGAMMALKAGS
ncbi:D-mannonate dehydratase [Yoonia maricola]|uniref:Mannonate dehydratase n=1 Tax=Yoonia maricola TaxID=420999 RepID=A0A2M8W365_9RHOB|nr:mannonate dehydratase [Yoonia maricola]PJI85386.1 D-mannonate dehydratase [Yoonia maricola]